jgi:restriction endonuclease S subunit
VQNGKVDVINSQHLGPRHIDYEGLEKTYAASFAAASEAHIQRDDLLIYTTGAYIGRTNTYLSDAPAMASNHVNILRLRPGIDAAYMAMVFQSVVGQFQTQKYARGSAQAELYPADIDRFLVPLIDADKQKAIGDLVRESLEKNRNQGGCWSKPNPASSSSSKRPRGHDRPARAEDPHHCWTERSRQDHICRGIPAQ